MNKEQRIKEISEVLSIHIESELDLSNDIYEIATALYEAGYRKQSDVAREFAERVINEIERLRSTFITVGYLDAKDDAIYEIEKLAAEYGVEVE